MKKLMPFVAALMVLASSAFAVCDSSYQTKIYTEQGGAAMHACSGSTITIESGGALVLASTSSLVQSNVDLTEKSLTASYGILGGSLAVTYDAAISRNLSARDVAASFGVSAATVAISNTGATALKVGGGITAGTGNVAIIGTSGQIPAISSTYFASLSGASLTTLTPANIQTGSLPVDVIASSFAVASVTNDNLAGSIAPAKITGTAAILGANSFTAAQNITGGVNISSNATAGSVMRLKGYTLAVSTHGVTEGDVWLENASGTFTIAICTFTVAENADGCVAGGCWVKK